MYKKIHKIGYARVSTDEQNLDLQMDALKEAGCTDIFTDQGISGSTVERDGLSAALNALKPGSILVVWKLDRLGRSLGFLCQLIDSFQKDNIGFQSITDSLNTNTSSGKLLFNIMGSLAEFERDLIRERTKAGMTAAKKRGKHVGRPKALSDAQVVHMKELLAKGKTQREVAELLGVSHNTVWRMVRGASSASKQNSTLRT